jgi:hypothetical protein
VRAGFAVPSPYHGILAVKGCARLTLRFGDRLRRLLALCRAGDGSGQFRPSNRSMNDKLHVAIEHIQAGD